MWGGSYQPGTLIWRSRWVTGDAIIECHEALALPARQDRAVILCRVIAQHGTARVHIDLNPRAGFGHHPLTKLAQAGDRTWTARTADRAPCLVGRQ